MEIFGVAANVTAALSLTIQLVESIENVGDFWKEVKAAPREVKQIIQDLELLRGILEGFSRT